MAHIFHGDWVLYTPDTLPVGAPSGAMFARRTGDGADWYDYVNPGTNFDAGSAVFMAYWVEGQNSLMVGSSVWDTTKLFPAGQSVYEIPNYSGTPQDLNHKLYDPATEAFSDPVPPEAPPQVRAPDDAVMQALAAIQNRLDALEHK